MHAYKTLKASGFYEYEISKSRFLCYLQRVNSEQDATEFIQKIKKQHYDARHNCSAYIVGERSEFQKANDDGEPSGTAGMPILEVLRKQELTNIVAVVTRYFGGIKLGAGGLIRAYGKATAIALEHSELIYRDVFTTLHLQLDYKLLGSLENYLQQQQLTVIAKDYAEIVRMTILVLPAHQQSIITTITNLTAGKCTIEIGDTCLVDLPLINTKAP